MFNKPKFIDGFEKCKSNIDWRMEIIEYLYNKNYLNNSNTSLFQIPKILHYIDSVIPENYKELIDIWKDNHQSWEFKMWNDDSIKNLDIDYELYKNMPNSTIKREFIKLSALYKFGGVYVDIDTLSLKPMDDLLYLNFFCGYNSFPNELVGPEKLDSSIIGSIPRNCMIGNILTNINSNFVFGIEIIKEIDPTLTVFFPPSFFYPLPKKFWCIPSNIKIAYVLNSIWQMTHIESYSVKLQ